MEAVAIVDSGGANIASLRYAFERLGVSGTPHASTRSSCERAARVILPGVGAAGDAMRRLGALGLAEILPTLTQPVLGICLGMQLLFAGERRGRYELSWPDSGEGRATRACAGTSRSAHGLESAPNRPQLRANRRASPTASTSISCTALPRPAGSSALATCEYGVEFAAVIQHGNFFGTQFHPSAPASAGATAACQFSGPACMELIPAIDLRGGRCVPPAARALRRRDALSGGPDRPGARIRWCRAPDDCMSSTSTARATARRANRE